MDPTTESSLAFPKESLTFLFFPLDAVGHMNAYIGIGQELVARGHKVVFAVSNGWRGKLEKYGFIEKYYQDEAKEGASNSVEKWGEMVRTMSPALAMPPLGKLEHFHTSIYSQLCENAKEADPRLREIVAEMKPHLNVVDCIHNPALSDVGIPWIQIPSINPIGININNVAPPFSGYANIEPDKALWEEFRQKQEVVYGPIFEDFRNWILSVGGADLCYDGRVGWTRDSPYGNLYMFPEELSYTMHRADLPNWYHFDCLCRLEPEPFEVPDELEHLPGKLIYISLGTIGCSELVLMRKVISICSKSPNRFIVSKGPLGDQLELGENMWGRNDLPQVNILPTVDLVISHGGNNTLTETFYFGKKILILPLFCDQLDNAQRVEEAGLGLKFDPYQVTEEELLQGIETLLRNDLLEKRMRNIGTRMRAANGRKAAAEFLEHVADSNAFSHSIYFG